MINKEQFGGQAEKRAYFLGPIEKRLVDKFTPKVPKSIETYHLTLMTIIWSLAIILFSYLAKNNINWLWLTSLMIFCQHVTDLLDGAVGRFRNTGLVKWGYYMDHFLDYIFLCSIIIGYSFILVGYLREIIIILVIFIGFMINTYVAFAATNKFKNEFLKISGSEIRVFFILINISIILFGTKYIEVALPYVILFSVISLAVIVYQTQKNIWRIDMEKKSNKT